MRLKTSDSRAHIVEILQGVVVGLARSLPMEPKTLICPRWACGEPSSSSVVRRGSPRPYSATSIAFEVRRQRGQSLSASSEVLGVRPVCLAIRSNMRGPILLGIVEGKHEIGPALLAKDPVRTASITLDRPSDSEQSSQNATRLVEGQRVTPRRT